MTVILTKTDVRLPVTMGHPMEDSALLMLLDAVNAFRAITHMLLSTRAAKKSRVSRLPFPSWPGILVLAVGRGSAVFAHRESGSCYRLWALSSSNASFDFGLLEQAGSPACGS
jgi:hypothetical protein